jgi:hypothetical protein
LRMSACLLATPHAFFPKPILPESYRRGMAEIPPAQRRCGGAEQKDIEFVFRACFGLKACYLLLSVIWKIFIPISSEVIIW